MQTNRNNQPKELGKISWYRSHQAALDAAQREGKPVFLLFQEVPGCATCVGFGEELLSYPLLAEAIENEFIPLAIYNNAKGEEERILSLYHEAPWNNPVVHFVDGWGADTVPRLPNPWEPFLLLDRMTQALKVSGRKLPEYVALLAAEFKIKYGKSHTAYYETPCFWSGETSMIQHPAVLATEAGWIAGKEVVKVTFDPLAVSLQELSHFAGREHFKRVEKPGAYRKDVNPQYYLKGSVFRLLPLGISQRSRLNYAIPYAQNAESYLSPLQYALLQQHRKSGGDGPELYDKAIEESWPDHR
ncbi:MAG: thioredoxin family protein [Chitinophagaceae bacterium]|nr:thioredoxin family protein [Chitinophagaceae bacterium]